MNVEKLNIEYHDLPVNFISIDCEKNHLIIVCDISGTNITNFSNVHLIFMEPMDLKLDGIFFGIDDVEIFELNEEYCHKTKFFLINIMLLTGKARSSVKMSFKCKEKQISYS